VATIRLTRPDLLKDLPAGEPIPYEVPADVMKKSVDYIEDIGEPITACFFSKAANDPTGW